MHHWYLFSIWSRIFADEVDAGGQRLDVVLEAGDFPVFHLAERLQIAVFDMQLLQRLVGEVHRDLLCARLVAGFDNIFHEFRLIQLGGDDDLVALL